MPSTYFSPNKSVTGGALFASFNSKEESVFFKIIKQTGWDAQKSKGSFTGGQTFNIKLSPDETGEFIHAISGHDSCKFYHTFNGEVTSGTFTYYEKEFTDKNGKSNKSRGFGLTVKKGDVEVKIGFSLGGAERLSQYLQFALDHIHSAIYAADKKEMEEYLKKKNNKPVTPQVVEATPEEVNPPEVVEEDSIQF